ncbi:RagB/SusD family nutrient uptake outer membrane protein [Maribacter aestuarii]|uniref:RagB/SusD family nutrient uptake outer membrane protein n=1 Tax=Maribacter aestuarii TaxID=1130723 RepID=UPI00248BBF46|nr:RagB/SusD family nutrient uptake outer membrane protein [Maribacter aestuarii]
MKRSKLTMYMFAALSVIGLSSCTDLEIEETDSIISEGFQGLADPASTVDELYNRLNGQYGDQANLFALTEVTTDSYLIPTRGADWGDNGLWRVLHSHSWDGQHQFIITVFNQYNGNQLLASQILDPRSNPSADDIGEASLIRAFSMWIILDLYGQVPFRDTSLPSSTLPEVLTGQAAVDFIIADLDQAISNLPSVAAGNVETVTGSKAAARYLKAKVLLNKHIYLGTAPDSGDMAQVISLVDEIAGEGYELQAGYFDLFRQEADNETIWAFESSTGNRIFNGLHYSSTFQSGGGWNGFSTLAEYYDLFEGDSESNRYAADGVTPLDGQEERRGGVPPRGLDFTGADGTTDTNDDGIWDGSNVGFGFLINQQYGPTGDALEDRQGAPLTFKRDFQDGTGASSFINNDETTGIRLLKYNPRFNDNGQVNHEIVFRYADAHLMKAEAMLRSGGDPTAMVNELRTLRNATPLGTVTEQNLIDERGRELYAEIWRRNDLIRFGQYGRDWLFKDAGSINNDTYNRFPIPPAQLLANPNLVQNPGY